GTFAGLCAAGLLAMLTLTATPSAAAQDAPQTVLREIDGERSDVGFELRILLRHLGGRFLSLRGALRIDDARQLTDIEVSLDSNSVWMAKESNAEYARSAEFFDAARHPHIRFSASGIPLSLFREGGEMAGTVELRGVTRPMTLTVEPSGCERPGDGCDVFARGSVDRRDFGMSSRMLFVGKQVDLSFRIRLRPLSPEEAPAAAPASEDA